MIGFQEMKESFENGGEIFDEYKNWYKNGGSDAIIYYLTQNS